MAEPLHEYCPKEVKEPLTDIHVQIFHFQMYIVGRSNSRVNGSDNFLFYLFINFFFFSKSYF